METIETRGDKVRPVFMLLRNKAAGKRSKGAIEVLGLPLDITDMATDTGWTGVTNAGCMSGADLQRQTGT
jgi:hypothetical protein